MKAKRTERKYRIEDIEQMSSTSILLTIEGLQRKIRAFERGKAGLFIDLSKAKRK